MAVLGIDIGTGGSRAVAIDADGRILASASEAHTDFVFSILCEELGFLGVSAVVLLFIVFLVRGAMIAMRSHSRFQAVLAAGIVTAALARALGERATASPFDIETREARVTFGRYTVRMIAEWDDMMTVRVERDGQVVSERGELVSVTMAHAPSASWLSGGFLYNEICGAGYEELLRAMGKLGKGQ